MSGKGSLMITKRLIYKDFPTLQTAFVSMSRKSGLLHVKRLIIRVFQTCKCRCYNRVT